jgi:hypothetical protein
MTGPAALRPMGGDQAPGPAFTGRAAGPGHNETQAGTPAGKRKKDDCGTAAAIP